MNQLLQLSEATAARRRVVFRLVDATDGFTPETAVDLTAAADVQVSKNGGAFANRLGAAPTEIGAGQYYYELTAAECDTEGMLTLKVTDATSRPAIVVCQVVPWDPYSTDFATAAALTVVAADVDSIEIATPALRSVGPVLLTAAAIAANGASAGIGAVQAYRTVFTVTGTFGGGTATIQSCADLSVAVPVWTNSGVAGITAAGSMAFSGPAAGLRVNVTGATSPSLTVNAIQQVPA